MDNNVQVEASLVGVVHVHTTERCWCEWSRRMVLVWCATVWCGKCNASCCWLESNSPLCPAAAFASSPGCEPARVVSAPSTRPKGPQRVESVDPEPMSGSPQPRPPMMHAAARSALFGQGGLTLAHVGHHKMPPPTSPAPVPAACMGGGPLRYAPAPGKSNNDPMGSLCARQRDTQAQKSSASVEHEGTRILTQPTYQASPSPN